MAVLDAKATTQWMLAFADLLIENTDYLTRLDAAIGDADHGLNMQRGACTIRAVLEFNSFDTPAGVLHEVGEAALDGIGGAAGPLYASLLFGIAKPIAQQAVLDPRNLSQALHAGVAALAARGRAERNDKTMFDSAFPAVEAMLAACDRSDLTQCIVVAQCAARAGRDATEPLQARRGRASYLGPRSVGHIDPGAASVTLLFEAMTILTGSA
jgi:phosphoenolpyruvate---glycerone phosphotransferase subunit DhaL